MTITVKIPVTQIENNNDILLGNVTYKDIFDNIDDSTVKIITGKVENKIAYVTCKNDGNETDVQFDISSFLNNPDNLNYQEFTFNSNNNDKFIKFGGCPPDLKNCHNETIFFDIERQDDMIFYYLPYCGATVNNVTAHIHWILLNVEIAQPTESNLVSEINKL